MTPITCLYLIILALLLHLRPPARKKKKNSKPSVEIAGVMQSLLQALQQQQPQHSSSESSDEELLNEVFREPLSPPIHRESPLAEDLALSSDEDKCLPVSLLNSLACKLLLPHRGASGLASLGCASKRSNRTPKKGRKGQRKEDFLYQSKVNRVQGSQPTPCTLKTRQRGGPSRGPTKANSVFSGVSAGHIRCLACIQMRTIHPDPGPQQQRRGRRRRGERLEEQRGRYVARRQSRMRGREVRTNRRKKGRMMVAMWNSQGASLGNNNQERMRRACQLMKERK